MEERLRQAAECAIKRRIFPGCVIGVTTPDTVTFVKAFGSLTYEPSSQIVSVDTVYDVASLTKVVPTSALALMFVDQGKLRLSDLILSYLPQLKGRYAEQVTIWHLLTHTISFTQHLSQHKDKSAEEILSLVLDTDYPLPPGSKYAYSNAASILLGMVVTCVGGEALDRLAAEYFFNPLGMTKTTFSPQLLKDIIIAPTEVDPWRGEVCGVVHDESAYVLEQVMVPGSAGLFSTVGDLLSFVQVILNKGTRQGKQYFSSAMIDTMATNQLAQIGTCTGLGWELNQSWFMGKKTSDKTIGKTGFTGCSMVCDLEKGVGIVILSNCDYPHRPANRESINKVRREIADIVFSYY